MIFSVTTTLNKKGKIRKIGNGKRILTSMNRQRWRFFFSVFHFVLMKNHAFNRPTSSIRSFQLKRIVWQTWTCPSSSNAKNHRCFVGHRYLQNDNRFELFNVEMDILFHLNRFARSLARSLLFLFNVYRGIYVDIGICISFLWLCAPSAPLFKSYVLFCCCKWQAKSTITISNFIRPTLDYRPAFEKKKSNSNCNATPF